MAIQAGKYASFFIIYIIYLVWNYFFMQIDQAVCSSDQTNRI